MLIESESPFMIPTQYRGKRNKPLYIHSTLEFIAELRGMEAEELADILYQNSLRVFGLAE
jgi:TatD DNase family protein